jgi:hypothetical protein
MLEEEVLPWVILRILSKVWIVLTNLMISTNVSQSWLVKNQKKWGLCRGHYSPTRGIMLGNDVASKKKTNSWYYY